MQTPSFGAIAVAIFVGYISYSIYQLYGLFSPQECHGKGQDCLQPYLNKNHKLEVTHYCLIIFEILMIHFLFLEKN